MNWWTLPESFSTFGDDIDAIFRMITWITVAIFLIVEVALLVFIVRYRKRDGRRAYHIHGSLPVELIWTAIPFLIVVGIAWRSAGTWQTVRSPSSVPDDAFPVRVEAKQFEWNATYAGADGRFETADDFTTRNEIHIPANHPVVVRLTAQDVIHSFFLPAMRVKQDAVPGMEQRVWFEATTAGEYVLGCAELCGLGHYRMAGTLTALDEADFERWYAEQGDEAALAVAGRANHGGAGAP